MLTTLGRNEWQPPNSHKVIPPNLKQTPIPVSQIDSNASCAAPHSFKDIMPSSDQDLPASVAVHDPQPLTNPMPGSDVVDPCPPSPKTAQRPPASMMPSSDVVDPKLTLPDAVASTAQPNKVDTSTPSAVEAVGKWFFG